MLGMTTSPRRRHSIGVTLCTLLQFNILCLALGEGSSIKHHHPQINHHLREVGLVHVSQQSQCLPSGRRQCGQTTTFKLTDAAQPVSVSEQGQLTSSSPASVGSSWEASNQRATSVAAIATSPVGGNSGKRGISYEREELLAPFQGHVSWKYNWGTSGQAQAGVEFVPMWWGPTKPFPELNGVAAALSFNEPDMHGQADIDPVAAAAKHVEAFSKWKGVVRIGSPAVTNGLAPMGIDWLERFFVACGGNCLCDFLAIHWYAGGPDASKSLSAHIQAAVDMARRHGIEKVWLTEFGSDHAGEDERASFMREAVQILEHHPAVERYAAFMASDGTLLKGDQLNTIGAAYIA